MSDDFVHIREIHDGFEFSVHVQPRAKCSEISGVHNGALKVKVTAPPVDDAANRAVIDFFSTFLHVSKSSVTISAGLKSRHKILRIKGVPLDRLSALVKKPGSPG
jgi:uncharacterized protein